MMVMGVSFVLTNHEFSFLMLGAGVVCFESNSGGVNHPSVPLLGLIVYC